MHIRFKTTGRTWQSQINLKLYQAYVDRYRQLLQVMNIVLAHPDALPVLHGDHTFVPIHDRAQTIMPTRLCPDTFVSTHVCAHTRLCPLTFVPRHVCAQTHLCSDTFVPRHVCAHTHLCPDKL